MHIEYQISESDYVAAVSLCRWTNGRGASLRIFVLPVMCALLAMPVAGILYAWQGLAPGLIPAILFLFCPLIHLVLWRHKLTLRYRDNPALHSRNFVDIDERGCRMQDLASDRFIPWSEVTAYAEDGKTFIRFLDGRGQFQITPKRELTDLQILELRKILADRVPQRGARQRVVAVAQLVAVTAVISPILYFAAPPLLHR